MADPCRRHLDSICTVSITCVKTSRRWEEMQATVWVALQLYEVGSSLPLSLRADVTTTTTRYLAYLEQSPCTIRYVYDCQCLVIAERELFAFAFKFCFRLPVLLRSGQLVEAAWRARALITPASVHLPVG